MLCHNCGTQRSDADFPCHECGAELEIPTSNIEQEGQEQSVHQILYKDAEAGNEVVKKEKEMSDLTIMILCFGGAALVFALASWCQSLVNSSMFSMYYEGTGIFRELLAEITFFPGWVISVIAFLIGVFFLVSYIKENFINQETISPSQDQQLIVKSATEESATMSNTGDVKKVCNGCGEGILDTERFCTSCGMPVRVTAEHETDTPKVDINPTTLRVPVPVPTPVVAPAKENDITKMEDATDDYATAEQTAAVERAEAAEKAAAAVRAASAEKAAAAAEKAEATERAAAAERAASTERVAVSEKAAVTEAKRNDSEEIRETESSELNKKAQVKAPPTIRVKVKKRQD